MRLSTGIRRSLATRSALIVAGVVLLDLLVLSLPAQQLPVTGAPGTDISNIPKNVNDTFDRVNLRNWPSDTETGKKKAGDRSDTCLLPPLTFISNHTIAAEQLKIPPKASAEYHQACEALKKKKPGEAEKHLRAAVQKYPKYSAAWVTLGQLLAARQQVDEARNACFQGSIEDASFIPAHLCLADIAARTHAWDEVLKLSSRALELDSTSDALAYEYQAAANLNLHNLAAAETSGLRAVAIDKDHHDPRVYFLLAQIYEAMGNPIEEAAQLRAYLKYADSPEEIAALQPYLAKLEERNGKGKAIENPPEDRSPGVVQSAMQRWGPADIDEAVPAVRSDTTCQLPQILKETSRRSEDFIENLQRFSANERIEQIDIGKNGKNRNTSQMVNYVAQIVENSSGYPTVTEYRYARNGVRQPSLMDNGTAAFALIFHPVHMGNFDFHCEGLTELRGMLAWQVHFEESRDPSKAFHAIRIGNSLYLPRFKGRAWIAANSYDVLRIETDLISPIAEIDLQLEHFIIDYAPVEFQNHQIQLWLPESASVHIAYRGRRYERVHSFDQFQLFSVDSAEAIKQPAESKAKLSQWAESLEQ